MECFSNKIKKEKPVRTKKVANIVFHMLKLKHL